MVVKYLGLFQTPILAPIHSISIGSLKNMMSGMLCPCHKFQILNSIIRSIMVSMMNMFFRSKISAEMFFHYKPMLKHITLVGLVWMIWRINQNIMTAIKPPTTFPSGTIFAHFTHALLKMAGVTMSVNKVPKSASLIFFRSTLTTATSTINHNLLQKGVFSI
jgi:hypothetical protein